MHPWNPYRAMKDDEVGEFYMKRKNYRAALARYQDALIWKEKDAVANFRMAQCYEKLDQPDQAIPHYEEYLKILPDGPYAKEARKALEKLKAAEAKNRNLRESTSQTLALLLLHPNEFSRRPIHLDGQFGSRRGCSRKSHAKPAKLVAVIPIEHVENRSVRSLLQQLVAAVLLSDFESLVRVHLQKAGIENLRSTNWWDCSCPRCRE